MTSPVLGLVVTSPSYISPAMEDEVASFVLQGLNVLGPSPIVEMTSSPPNFPTGACDWR